MPLLSYSPSEVSTVAFDSFQDYQFWIQNEVMSDRRAIEEQIVKNLNNSNEAFLLIAGYCAYCQKAAHFLIDSVSGKLDLDQKLVEPNWRERLICIRCNLNNRNRFLWIFLNNFPSDSKTWFVDYGSSMLPTLASKFGNLNHKDSNAQTKLDHEQTLVEFQDNQFRLHLSLETIDIVEELSDYLFQAYRTLVSNGRFVATFPFNQNLQSTQSSDTNNRQIGWDILDQMRTIGFIDVQFISGWSSKYVHLGPDQFFLYATK